MLIEIDDAGIGSPVGGLIIGALKGNTYRYKVIPVDFFQGNTTNNGVKIAVLKATFTLLEELEFDPLEDQIHICQGDIFKQVHQAFQSKNYKWTPISIRSKLQDLVEATFDLHLISLGVPRLLLKRLMEYRHYVTELLKWVVMKKDKRVKYVKTRYNIWKNEWQYSTLSFERKKANKDKYCIECGDDIKRGDSIYLVRIKTIHKTFYTYLHEKCGEEILDFL